MRLGLRLANSYLGIGVIIWIYALWLLIGLVLGLVIISFALLGQPDIFKDALNSFALYGFVLPMALTAAITWAVKLFSRFLWCAISEPLTAKLLALVSVTGRLSVLLALAHMWLSVGPFGKGLLLPETIACAGIGWLGLVAEWRFIRTLRRAFIPATDPAQFSEDLDDPGANATEADGAAEHHKKSLLTRDLGEWFQSRFPGLHKLVAWIVLPIAYAIASSLAENGNLQAVPDTILRFVVIAPAVLQVFWIPGMEIDGLIGAFSQKTAEEDFHSK